MNLSSEAGSATAASRYAAAGARMIRRAVHRAPDATGASFPVLQGGPFEQVATDIGPFWMVTSDEVMRPYMLERGRWDESTADLLEELIQPGCRFLNVGASVGYFPVFAHRVCGAATVDAVEPHPITYSALEANLWANDVPAQTWRIALADERKLLPMTSAPMNPGDTRLAQHSPDGRYELVVPVISGDELFTGRTFDLIKISVQGFELEVLLGLQRIVRQSAGLVLVVEFSPTTLRDRGLDPSDAVEHIRSLGFAIAVHDAWGVGNCEVGEVVAHCDSAGSDGHVNLILRADR